MVHSMICMSGQPGNKKTKNNFTDIINNNKNNNDNNNDRKKLLMIFSINNNDMKIEILKKIFTHLNFLKIAVK